MATKLKWLILVLLVLGLAFGGASAARAQEYYKDKTITFIVAYSPGGSFDQYARLISRHIGKHIPGEPTTVVQNMTGAGGIIAANHLFNRVKPDGLTIGAWAAPLVLQHVMGNDAIKFDGRKFGYLGVPSPYDTACHFNRESGIKTPEDWFAAKRPVKISSIGPGTSTSDVPKLLKAAIGLPLDVVEGYKGGAEARLAVESGEVESFCGSWQATKTAWRSVLESGKIRVVLQVTLKSHSELKDVPLATKYAKTDESRLLLNIADSTHGYQFPFSIPPGTPPDRLKILQDAFMKSLKDPELLAEAKKAQMEINPTDGPTITKAFSSLYDISPAMIGKLKDILITKK